MAAVLLGSGGGSHGDGGGLWVLLGIVGGGTLGGSAIGGINGNTQSYHFELDRAGRSNTTNAATGAP